MPNDDASARFLDLLVTRHDGEVSGEGVFAGLAETCADDGQRYKWRVCEALERETKQLLARDLAARGRTALENPGCSAGRVPIVR